MAEHRHLSGVLKDGKSPDELGEEESQRTEAGKRELLSAGLKPL